MSGVKTRRSGECVHRFWYEKGTDNKLIRVLRIVRGKKSWFWAVRTGDGYRKIPSDNIERR